MLIDAYLNRLRLASFRPTTITTRRSILLNFTRRIDPTVLEQATRLHVEAFLARDDLSPNTRRVYRSSLRHFYGWAVEEGYVQADPTLRVPSIRCPQGVPRPVSEDDLRHALAVADLRMRSWLLLMSLAGLRCMEVAGLRPADLVQTENGFLLMLKVTKGGASATVPAHPRVAEVLLALPVVEGRWWDVAPRTVSRQVGEHLKDAGVAATAHQLRHTAATSWLRASGEDLLTVRRLMRHKSVATTQVYAEIVGERPAEVVSLVRAAG